MSAAPAARTRVARAQRRRAEQRRRRSLRTLVIALTVAALSGLPVSATAPSHACGPTPAGAAVVEFGQLDDDGELNSLRQRTVGADGEVCEETQDAPALDVAVSILHRDQQGRSLEASELGGDDPVRTQVSVRDTTSEERVLTVTGPEGTTTETRRVGVPQVVRTTIRYPASWDVSPPRGDGVSTRLDGDDVEVARTAVLFPPLLDDEVVLETLAVPGRGTPRVTVEAAPLATGEAERLPAGLLDRDTTAVVAAMLDLAEGGARELTEGAEELAGGSDELAGGAAEVADGAASVGDGMAGFADGVGGLSSGIDGSAGGANELAGGAGELAGGTAEIAAGVQPLGQGADQLASGVRMLSDELASFADVEAPEVDPEPLVEAVEGIADEIRAVRDHLAQLLPSDPDPEDPIVVAVTVLTELADGLEAATDGILTALEGMSEAVEGLQAAAAGADELAMGAEELAQGIAELEGGLQGLADGAAALARGTEELASGLGQLSGASDELEAGADELTVGAQGIAEGTAGLADGSRQLSDGVEGLAEGAGELPGALGEALGVADRGGQRSAVTAAILDEGAARAEGRRGPASLVTTQLVHPGESPLPWLPIGLAAAVLALGGGTATWWLRQRGGRA